MPDDVRVGLGRTWQWVEVFELGFGLAFELVSVFLTGEWLVWPNFPRKPKGWQNTKSKRQGRLVSYCCSPVDNWTWMCSFVGCNVSQSMFEWAVLVELIIDTENGKSSEKWHI